MDPGPAPEEPTQEGPPFLLLARPYLGTPALACGPDSHECFPFLDEVATRLQHACTAYRSRRAPTSEPRVMAAAYDSGPVWVSLRRGTR